MTQALEASPAEDKAKVHARRLQYCVQAQRGNRIFYAAYVVFLHSEAYQKCEEKKIKVPESNEQMESNVSAELGRIHFSVPLGGDGEGRVADVAGV